MLCFQRRAFFLLTALLCASLPASEAGGEPGIPQDLRVTPHGPSTVLLTWMKPSSNDVDHYLVYVEGEDLEHTTHNTFFALDGLAASTAYTFGVRTVSASAVMSEPALVDGQTSVDSTAEDKPEPPHNLQVSPQGSSDMLVVWSKPSNSDVDHYYMYVEGTGLEDTRPDTATFYIWQGLETCTTYTFGVQTVSSTGVYSDPAVIDGTTGDGCTPEDKPEPPHNLQVSPQGSDMLVVWSKPPNTVVDHYYMYVEGTGLEDTRPNTATFYIWQGLEPSTTYTFGVQTVSSTGVYSDPAVIDGTTGVGNGPPQNLTAEGVSSSAINVSWCAPHLQPDYYLITAFDAGIIEERVLDLQYLIDKGLDPCQTCDITVTSVYEDDGGRFDSSTRGETEAELPGPPKGCSVEAQELYITVTWDKPTSHCALGNYSVYWTVKKLWGNFEEESYSTNTLGTSLVVTDKPLPYHSYTFEISASVDGMFGDSTSCSGTSLETSAGPPVLVSVVSEKEGEVQVEWEPPAEENGQIIEYGIFVNDAADFVKNVSGEVRSTNLPLEKCVSVDISVAARNHADNNDDGWGQRSAAKSVTTTGDVVPNNIECPVFGAYLQACWFPYSTDCPASQYNLEWDGVVLWSSGDTDSGSTTLDWSKDEICYNISTVPFTQYTISLNVGKNTEVPVTCSVTSPMAAPGPPTLDELQVDNLTISVTWIEPVVKNGIISNYRVEWTDWNDLSNSQVTDENTFLYEIMLNSCGGDVDVTVSAKTAGFQDFGERSPPRSASFANTVLNLTCESTSPGEVALSWMVPESKCPIYLYNVTWSFTSLWSEDEGSGWEAGETNVPSVTLESLPPYSDVSVALYVANSGPAPKCTATTLEEASSAPRNLQQIAKELHSITVEWSLPEFSRGKLSGWYLYWTSAAGHFLGEQVIESPEERALEIASLEPSETYYVHVMAVNGAGRGEEAVVEATTDYVPGRGGGGGGGHAVF